MNDSRRPSRCGFSRWDLLVVIMVLLTFFAVALPALRQHRDDSMLTQSKFNLLMLSAAHYMYSADHNGNQWTVIPHDLAKYGITLKHAVTSYNVSVGDSPGGTLTMKGIPIFSVFGTSYGFEAGWGCSETSCGNWFTVSPSSPMPIRLFPHVHGGHFRWQQVKSFNAYVGGAFYDPTFYAPKDVGAIENAGECFGWPGEFCIDKPFAAWGSYALSPAAMFHPDLWSLPEGEFPQSESEIFTEWPMAFQSPTFSQVAYPDLKTHLIEHNWLQNFREDDPCHPELSSSDPPFCAPWYFNHSIHSQPLALFYDGHIRLLPNTEVQTHEKRVQLWRRDTGGGANGYGLNLAADDIVDVSHHILTKDGALGRDTLGPLPTR